jgi:3-oxoacyl-[acyl-carrier-protein] synthase-1
MLLHPPGIVCTLGDSRASVREALFSGGRPPNLKETEAFSPGRPLTLGGVESPLLPLPNDTPKAQRSRNNQMLLTAFSQIERDVRVAMENVPKHRVAVILGTSTTGMFESENAVRLFRETGQLPPAFHYSQQELGSPSRFLADYLGVPDGVVYSISTACTSSAKAIISGARLLAADLCDIAVVGGVDTLTRFTVAGFSSLGAVSAAPCLPFSANRCGINIGEGASVFLMTKAGTQAPTDAVVLAGYGASSDAHHISAPDPSGKGAALAIHAALARAGISADEVGYVNLHGTATKHNDAMEGTVMTALFPNTPMSSTKALTGHTLGAAGAVEAAIAWFALTDAERRLPPQLNDNEIDPAFDRLHFVAPGECAAEPINYALSTSYAFGGNNAALLFRRAANERL